MLIENISRTQIEREYYNVEGELIRNEIKMQLERSEMKLAIRDKVAAVLTEEALAALVKKIRGE